MFFYYVYDLAERNVTVDATSGVAMYSPLVYKPSRRYEAWRFISYMLMHQGYVLLVMSELETAF